MGCFDSTCAVSNYPIHRGDKVICFYLNKFESEIFNKGKYSGEYGGGNTYSLMRALSRYFQYAENQDELISRHSDDPEYREYLNISAKFAYPFADIVIGEYDDYGNVEDVGNKYDQLAWFFIRYEVWEFFSQKLNISLDDKLTLLRNIIWTCYLAHHDIVMAGTLIGEQYFQQENLKDYNLIDECRELAKHACFDNNERFYE